LGARAAYQPVDPATQIERVESTYNLELGDANPWFSAWALGDGQAYALIAADISGQKLADYVQETTYRFARAGFGWMAGAFSLGREPLIPYGLALAGALALVGVIVATVMLRPRLGPRAWLILLNPALYIAFAGDTSESLAILLLVLAIGWGSWVAALALGVTSPTFLVAVWGRWRLVLAGAASAASLAVYSFFAFGSESFIPHGGRIGLPFVSYLDHPSVWGALLAGAALGTIGIGARHRDWSWILAGVFVLCFGWDVLRDPVNAWRAAGFLPVLWAFGPRYEPSPVPVSSSSEVVEA